jgi:hypothetical protein
MWGNLILVATNAPCGWAVYRAIQRDQLLAAMFLGFAGGASMLYHGAETHKHPVLSGLGYGRSKEAQLLLLGIDRWFAILAFVMVLATSQPSILVKYLPAGLLLLVCVGMSEVIAPLLPDNAHLYVHVFFHSLWHLGVFFVADLILSDRSPLLLYK